jgi:drug/metabolite transporter, DME family
MPMYDPVPYGLGARAVGVLHYRPVSRPRVPDPVTPGPGIDPRLLVVAAAVLWGTTGTARALGPDAASPTAVGASRLVVGAAGLVAVHLVTTRKGEVAPPGGGRARRWLPVAGAAVAIAAYQPLFFGGVARTGVAVGTVVGIGSAPVFAGLLGMVVRGERPGTRWTVATAAALAGTGLLVVSAAGDAGPGGAGADVTGLGLALGAGLAYAVYALASKLALDAGWTPDALTVRVIALAGVLVVPVAVAAGVGPLGSPSGVVMILHLGVVTMLVGYLLFGRGLAGVGVGTAGTLTLAEPATAAVLGVIVLGERFGGATTVGIALIAAGLATLATQRA